MYLLDFSPPALRIFVAAGLKAQGGAAFEDLDLLHDWMCCQVTGSKDPGSAGVPLEQLTVSLFTCFAHAWQFANSPFSLGSFLLSSGDASEDGPLSWKIKPLALDKLEVAQFDAVAPSAHALGS
jgi:hypothetical protein